MNGVNDNSGTGPAEADAGRHLEVVVVYEDFDMGIRGKQVFEGLVRTLGNRFELNCKLWKFDVLKVRPLRKMAADDAATADLVLIAAHNDAALPGVVNKWLESWVTRGGPRHRALVSLSDPPVEGLEPHPADTYLQQVARKGHLDFLCAATDSTPADAGWIPARDAPVTDSSPLLEAILHRRAPSAQFGIND